MSRVAHLHFNDWAGRRSVPVEVVNETPKRIRIRAIERTKLAGADRWLAAGETALVPKAAVRPEPAPENPRAAARARGEATGGGAS